MLRVLSSCTARTLIRHQCFAATAVTGGLTAGSDNHVTPLPQKGDMASAVKIDKSAAAAATAKAAGSKPPSKCGPENTDDDDEMEDMFIQGPAGVEWGGPTR